MSELVVFEQKPLSVVDVQHQVNLIQEVMKRVMKKGEHYGTIPGCGTKPTLLKPGAEKIISTFRLCPDFEVEDLSYNEYPQMIRYRIKCNLTTFSGVFVGAGVGECSSREDKYMWKKANEKEYENSDPGERRIKYGKYEQKQVMSNPYDLANTILKMAKKRALVDACLTTTAASDIFTQDIEDMDFLHENGHKKSEPKIEKLPPVDADYHVNFDKIVQLLGALGGETREGMQSVFKMFCVAKDAKGDHKKKVSDLTISEQLELINTLEYELASRQPSDQGSDRDVPVQDDSTQEELF